MKIERRQFLHLAAGAGLAALLCGATPASAQTAPSLGSAQSFADIESPADVSVGGEPCRLARAGIHRSVRPLRYRGVRDCGTRAAAGVKQALCPQALGRSGVSGEPHRLRRHFGPFETEPGEVGAELVGQLGARTDAVDVLDPQQEPACARPRQVMRDDRRISVAQVQRPVGAGGEAGDCHARFIGCAQACSTCKSFNPLWKRTLQRG